MSPAQETQSMREIRLLLTRETPAKRGRVNRYEIICKFQVQKVNILKELFYTLAQTYGILSHPTLKV
jgi:hypothetical protein